MAQSRGFVLRSLPLLSVAAAVALLALPGALAEPGMALLHSATLLVALVSLVRGPELGRSLRSSRLLFAAALACSAAGVVLTQLLVRADGSVLVPSAADPFSLAAVPLAMVGFCRVPRHLKGIAWARVVTDALLAATALLFATWLTVLEPLLEEHGASHLAVGTQAAYPVLDVLLITLVVSLIASSEADTTPFLDAVVVGLVLVAVADTLATVSVVRDGAQALGWADVPLQGGMALLAYAPWRGAATREVRPWRRVVDPNLVQLPVLLAAVVGFWYVAGEGQQLDADECLVAGFVLLAAVARQVLHSVELTNLLDEQVSLASHDALTCLSSRHALVQRLSRELEQDDQRARVAVVKVDIDGFEEINHALGLPAGDVVLTAVAETLSGLDDVLLAARIGGDDFGLLVPADAAERVAAQVAGPRSVAVDDGLVDVTCTAGWAEAAPGDAAHDLLARARLALHAAKSEPRRQRGWTPALDASAQRRRRVIAGLAHAVERGELALHYQPIHGLTCFDVIGVEALMRWNHSALGAVGPGEFIPLAEDSGHIVALGEWAVDRVLHQMQSWDLAGTPVPVVFVNLSAQQLTPHFRDRVLALLAARAVDPYRLVLELTENSLSDEGVNRVLVDLRKAGVRVAVDDFGAGYSTLARLSQLPVDVLKLDRELVVNGETPRGRDVLRAAVDLAKALDLVTVVEGIETREQLHAVQASGADSAQGFLLSRPLPADALAVTPGPWVPLPRPPRSLTLVEDCTSPLSSTLCRTSACDRALPGSGHPDRAARSSPA